MTFFLPRSFFYRLAIAVSCLSAACTHLWAEDRRPVSFEQDTMLMFVGEETKVLRIASRREESAWQAPAIARVVTRKELITQGAVTMSDALKVVPGFYMAEKEGGTEPFFRGIPDSVLFLYDTVPLGSEVSKSIHQLDYDISLAAVKRLEIVSGPGSVLWGPDAFAGIVNYVPMSGKDLNGVETDILYQGPGNQIGFYVNAGHDGGIWDAFLSVSGRRGEEDDRPYDIVRFWGDNFFPVPPADRLGAGEPGDAEYLEAFGQLSYGDWINLSGRIATNEKPYTMTSGNGAVRWGESRSTPFGYVKLEAKTEPDAASALRFTGYYSNLRFEHEVIDRSLTQKESTFYGELIYDRSVMGRSGMFTGGVSYRHKQITDAPVWQGYLPGYLESANPLFFPILLQQSYDSWLGSVFGQFTKTIRNFDLYAGLRYDMFSDLDNHLSFNAGLGWSPDPSWRIKLLYGTAYRTPFARQLYEEIDPELEKINSFNLQVAWKRHQNLEFSATGFYQHIENYVMQDPYAGLSLPNEQDIYGTEIAGRFSPHKSLNIQANVTLLQNSGPDEQYRYLKDITIDSEGNIIKQYAVTEYPYNLGAEPLFNLMATWSPVERFTLYARAGYIGERSLIFPRDEALEKATVPGTWIVDAAAILRGIGRGIGLPGLDLEVSVKNLTDNHYETPGTYDLIPGQPFTAQAQLRCHF